jgi:Xaa-Pro aminopeptidase
MIVIELPHLPGFFGFETITMAPLDMKLIEDSLLTDKEKAWIKEYQEQVQQMMAAFRGPEVSSSD